MQGYGSFKIYFYEVWEYASFSRIYVQGSAITVRAILRRPLSTQLWIWPTNESAQIEH
jgi:hypothetical protein